MPQFKNEEELILYFLSEEMKGNKQEATVARMSKVLLPVFAGIINKEHDNNTDPSHIIQAITYIVGAIIYCTISCYAKLGSHNVAATTIIDKVKIDVLRMLDEEEK